MMPVGASRAGIYGAVGAIPDSGDLHARYDWREASGTTTVTDQTGNGFDLTGSYTGPTTTINGNQAGRFDAANSDEVDVSFSPVDTPLSIFLTIQLESVDGSDTRYIFDSADSEFEIFLNEQKSGEWQFGGSSFYDDGAADTNPHILSIFYDSDGNTSEFYIDGEATPSASGDIGVNSLQGLIVGDDGSGTARHADFRIGEKLIYPQDKRIIRADVESYLSDGWDVPLV